MKIALYIEEGLEQIVLTPETDSERAILGKMHDGSRTMGVKHGGFAHCRGGWVREFPEEKATIIVLEKRKPQPAMAPYSECKHTWETLPNTMIPTEICMVCGSERLKT